MTKALSLCAHLDERLNNLQGTSLLLHSMFDSSANFMAGDHHLITFLAARTPPAVSSIVLPAADIRTFFGQDQSLWLSGTVLRGASVVIHLEEAKRISPLLAQGAPLNQAELLARVKAALLQRIPERGIYQEIAGSPRLDLPDLPGKGRYADRFERFLDGFSISGADQALAETVRSLIGYGIGLTPSADDFLLGFLAACSSCEAWFLPLAAACQANLHRTTTISAEMLYHGSQGRFSQAIVQLLGGSEPDQALSDLLAHGHSSGHDTLCGVYAGLLALQTSARATL